MLEDLVPNCGLEASSESERIGRVCNVPKLKESTETKNLRDKSFQSTGPKLFNSLPKYLRNLSNIKVEDFKEALDKYLSDIPDEPNVPG